MNEVGTFAIGLDTPIHLLTPRQLFEMMSEWQAKVPKVEHPNSNTPKKWYVNSIQELAKILGTSTSTVYRMKSNGDLDDCISQFGRWMMIDVEMVIEKFRLSNRRRKRRH